MERRRLFSSRLSLVAAAVFLWGLVGCSGGPGPAATNQSGDLAALQQQVAGQGTRIAALETKVALPRPAVFTATATPRPAPPTPTIVPAVAGLAVGGTTKGVATAKVTITEYLDYL